MMIKDTRFVKQAFLNIDKKVSKFVERRLIPTDLQYRDMAKTVILYLSGDYGLLRNKTKDELESVGKFIDQFTALKMSDFIHARVRGNILRIASEAFELRQEEIRKAQHEQFPHVVTTTEFNDQDSPMKRKKQAGAESNGEWTPPKRKPRLKIVR